MGDNERFSRAQCSLLFWAFLQADCGEYPQEYRNELMSLAKCLKDPEAICGDLETDGQLETDGHLSTSIGIAVEDIEPSLDVASLENIQHVAAELRGIAAQLELNAVARATRHLSDNILGSASTRPWRDYLEQEVQNILTHGVGLDHVPQERVVAALAFTLVKGVCLQAPSLIRRLFHLTLQYLGGR